MSSDTTWAVPVNEGWSRGSRLLLEGMFLEIEWSSTGWGQVSPVVLSSVSKYPNFEWRIQTTVRPQPPVLNSVTLNTCKVNNHPVSVPQTKPYYFCFLNFYLISFLTLGSVTCALPVPSVVALFCNDQSARSPSSPPWWGWANQKAPTWWCWVSGPVGFALLCFWVSYPEVCSYESQLNVRLSIIRSFLVPCDVHLITVCPTKLKQVSCKRVTLRNSESVL